MGGEAVGEVTSVGAYVFVMKADMLPSVGKGIYSNIAAEI